MTASSRSTTGRAPFTSLTAAGLLALLLLATISGVACGDGGEDRYAGYWRIPRAAPVEYGLVTVRPRDDSYEVRLDTLPWRQATVVDGRLRLQEQFQQDRAYAPGLDLELTDGTGVILVSASPSPASWALTRLDEQRYRAQLNVMADEELDLALLALSELAKDWAREHDGRPPAVADMDADSAFGRYVSGRVAQWPRNPFTGDAMRAGDEPGDFSYATNGGGFTLTAVSSSGSPVSP